jgi:hypothetical protein
MFRVRMAHKPARQDGTMMALRFIKPGELRLATEALIILFLLFTLGSLISGIMLLPEPGAQVSGTVLDHRGGAAASRTWPSTTPHKTPWPPPAYWIRTSRPGLSHYQVSAPNSTFADGNRYSLELYSAGWPLPVIERRKWWWDRNDPALKGPSTDQPPLRILYLNLALNALILGGGLWLVVFGPLGLFVVGRRVVWTLRGHCTFCGYDMTGFEQCPECGWRATGSVSHGSKSDPTG